MNSKRRTHIFNQRPLALSSGRLLGALAAAALLALFTASCSLATVGPGDGSINPKLSIMGLQGDVNEVNISITGQDYQRSVTVNPSSSNVEFFLPRGDDVKFEIEAENQDSATSHIYTWGMTRYADLVQGETSELDFVMAPKETKIFIPDYHSGYITGAGTVVQLSTINAQEDISLLNTEEWLSVDTNGEYPFDVALDNQGRIWISYINNGDITTSYSLVMRENLSLPESHDTGVIGGALAFDHSNSYLYFYHYDTNLIQYQLARISVTRNTATIDAPESFDVTVEPEISFFETFGLAVDNDGYVYFAGSDGGDFISLYKYDPNRSSGNRVIAKVTSEKLGYSNIDLLVKNNHLYVTNPAGSSGELILKFTKNLDFVDSFGTPSDGTLDEVGEFIQPTRFLTTTSDSIYVTDDDDSGIIGTNRIIKFNDTDGSGWYSYNPITSVNTDALDLFFIGT